MKKWQKAGDKMKARLKTLKRALQVKGRITPERLQAIDNYLFGEEQQTPSKEDIKKGSILEYLEGQAIR